MGVQPEFNHSKCNAYVLLRGVSNSREGCKRECATLQPAPDLTVKKQPSYDYISPQCGQKYLDHQVEPIYRRWVNYSINSFYVLCQLFLCLCITSQFSLATFWAAHFYKSLSQEDP